VEPRQPKPANGASWIFHSFLPFPFPPLDPGRAAFPFSPTGGLGSGFWAGTDQRAECWKRARETIGGRHWRTISDRHVDPGIHHSRLFCYPLGSSRQKSNASSDERRRGLAPLGCARTTSWHLSIVNFALRQRACTRGQLSVWTRLGAPLQFEDCQESGSTEWSIPGSCKPVRDMHGWRASHALTCRRACSWLTKLRDPGWPTLSVQRLPRWSSHTSSIGPVEQKRHKFADFRS
jgi:hypothetical protein